MTKGLVSIKWDGTDDEKYCKSNKLHMVHDKTNPSNASLVLISPTW